MNKSLSLDLTSLFLDRVIYEPEVFPGLIYKVKKPDPICFLIFSSGRVICTGANKIEVVKREVKTLAISLKEEGLLGMTLPKIPEKLDLDELDLF